MKVFVINLEQEKRRMQAIVAQLVKLGVEYERIPAIYGKALSDCEKKDAVVPFRWWCAVGRGATDGEIGCGLSHAFIFRKMSLEKIPIACILEDDVLLDERFPKILKFVCNHLSSDRAQVILLSNHSDGDGQLGDKTTGYRSPPEQKPEIRAISYDFFAECYVLNLKAAEALLKANFPMATPYDWWGRWKRLNIIELFHAFPSVASQNKADYTSETSLGIVPVASMRPWKYVLHKVMRLFGKLFDRAHIFLHGK